MRSEGPAGPPDQAVRGPLDGLLVVDLSLQLPGPYATLLLATLGARVVKVEPPGGDPSREIDPDMFARVNSGKQLLTLDLKNEAGRAALRPLVERADVLVEGFRPGVMERLGFGWEAASELNPLLIYCSLSGFGREGELARHPGHDINFLGLAGGIAGGVAGDGETALRVPFVDLASGTNAALAVVSHVLGRAASGRGRYLDMALLDAAVVWSLAKLPRGDGGAEPLYGVFQTRDGDRVTVSVMEDDMWQRLCAALDWSDWHGDPALTRHSDRRLRAGEIRSRLTAALASRSRAEVLRLAHAHDLGFAAVNDAGQVADDPQIATRGLLDGDDRWSPLGPAAGSLELAAARPPGADTLAVLADAGLDAGEVARLAADGAFADAEWGAETAAPL